MTRTIAILAVTALILSGCARVRDSKVNPANWFGKTTIPQTAPADLPPLVPASRVKRTVDSRGLVASVGQVQVTPTPEGALVRAVGSAGGRAYSAELVEAGRDGTTMSFEFRAREAASAGSRQISVATFLDNADIGGIRTFRIIGQSNSQLVRAR